MPPAARDDDAGLRMKRERRANTGSLMKVAAAMPFLGCGFAIGITTGLV